MIRILKTILILNPLLSSASCVAGVHVILVGVDQQDDSQIHSLPQAATDVAELQDALGTAGVRDGVDGTTVTTLCCRGTRNERPTAANILRTLRATCSELRSDDVLLFYFSGHAVRHQEQAALIPCDATATGRDLVSVSQLRSIIETSQAGNKLVIIDSCFSGGFSGFDPLAPVAEAFVGANVYAITSSRDDQLSVVWPSRRQSLATRWLCHGLKGGADRDLDGRISMDELFSFARANVPQCFPVVLSEIEESSSDGTALLNHNQHSQLPQRMIGPPWENPQLFEIQPLSADQAICNLAEQLADRITVASQHRKTDVPARVAVLPASTKVGTRLQRGRYPVLEQIVGPDLTQALIGSSRGCFELLSPDSVYGALIKSFTVRSLQTQQRSDFRQLTEQLQGEVDYFVDVRLFLRNGHLVLQAELLSSTGGAVAFTTSQVVKLSADLRVALNELLDITPLKVEAHDQVQSQHHADLVEPPVPSTQKPSTIDQDDRPLSVSFYTADDFGRRAWQKALVDEQNTFRVCNDQKLKVVVENKTDRYLAAIVYVDGINIMGKKPQMPSGALKNADYWIFAPGYRGKFASWYQRQKTMSGNSSSSSSGQFVAEDFLVTDAPASVAQQLSFSDNLGDIRICLFETRDPHTKSAVPGRPGIAADQERTERLKLHHRSADPARHITNLVFKYVQGP